MERDDVATVLQPRPPRAPSGRIGPGRRIGNGYCRPPRGAFAWRPFWRPNWLTHSPCPSSPLAPPLSPPLPDPLSGLVQTRPRASSPPSPSPVDQPLRLPSRSAAQGACRLNPKSYGCNLVLLLPIDLNTAALVLDTPLRVVRPSPPSRGLTSRRGNDSPIGCFLSLERKSCFPRQT